MDNKKIHCGKIVESVFNQNKASKKEFAAAVGIHVQNLNREFKNVDWSVIKMINAGKFLKHDFGYLFSLGKKQPKMLLQIEVTNDKINDVLAAVENQKLCEILRE
jgi:plasmid maintenance system antidote protein VapI